MVAWLVPIAFFWILAAVYLGGADIRFDGGGGLQQVLGLLLAFAGFLAVWAVSRMVLGGMMPGPLAVGVALAVGAATLPLVSRLTFRLVGVRIHAA